MLNHTGGDATDGVSPLHDINTIWLMDSRAFSADIFSRRSCQHFHCSRHNNNTSETSSLFLLHKLFGPFGKIRVPTLLVDVLSWSLISFYDCDIVYPVETNRSGRREYIHL